MNELSYITSLTESLAKYVDSEETNSKSRFAKIYFDLLISSKKSHQQIILRPIEKNVYITSIKLLFKKYNDETLEAFVKRFIRDDDPALTPAFELVLLSVNPNNLKDQEINQLIKSFEGSSLEKKTLILSFLYGGRFTNGFNNYELLSEFGSNVLRDTDNEIKSKFLVILNNHKALHHLDRRPRFQQMLRQLETLILDTIDNQRERGRFITLERTLNEL